MRPSDADRRLPEGERRIGEHLAGLAQTTADSRQAASHHAERDRKAGAALADEAAGASWRSTADAAIAQMADRGVPFTVDDLVDITGLPEARNPRAMGPRFSAAAHAGLIVQVGYTTSRRPSAHSAVVRVWRGAWAARDVDAA